MKSEMLKYTWDLGQADRAAIGEMARAMGIPRIVAQVLLLRGVTTPEAAHRFLNPSTDNLSDPFLLTDMRAAVERIALARDRGETVLVFGDYDVDGIAATALLTRALERFGLRDVKFGMPNRLVEGYGLNPERVLQARDEGVSLIITVDNGIAAQDAARAAREYNIDLIITDHHNLDDSLPLALAIINPKREAEDHPAQHLCGAGVAFKLAWALTGGIADLDVVALGTVADVVPLQGENRDLVAMGLEQARKKPRPGLYALSRVARVDLDRLRAEDIAFQLAPRINAGGRMGDGFIGLRLLLTDEPEEAHVLARELDAANEERRLLEQTILDDALARLEASGEHDRSSVVLGSRNWHAGVVGIVASRLQKMYHCPAVLVAFDENGDGRGSARSVGDFDVCQAVGACQEHLIAYGGHRAAAGMSLREENLPAFQEMFEAAVAGSITDEHLCPRLNVDAQVALSEMDSRLVTQLDQLEPFGHANPSPVFSLYGAEVVHQSWRQLNGNHLRFTLREGPRVMVAIGFRMGQRYDELVDSPMIDLVFTPRFNHWLGESTIQLVLKDWRRC
ncbi:MAG: single-stranded-DNA-specific exonuclease RecJ [Candidatus Hydrogenedentes bacterium]|nr:single-stranded-DNA-specific exonuclease RecJ [Candidatus Hydrogenedentota bacterium]